MRPVADPDGRFELRGDEAEDAPSLGDVLLVLDLLAEFERAQCRRARLFEPPAPEQRFGQEAVVLREADVAGGGRHLDGLPEVCLGGLVLAQPDARAAEVAEVEYLAVAVADLARD